MANYRQTILTAFQGVGQLSTAKLSQQAVVENAAVKPRSTPSNYLNEYKAGTVAYTTVITAKPAVSDQQSALAVQTNRMTASVALIKALGGGWNTSSCHSADRRVKDSAQVFAMLSAIYQTVTLIFGVHRKNGKNDAALVRLNTAHATLLRSVGDLSNIRRLRCAPGGTTYGLCSIGFQPVFCSHH